MTRSLACALALCAVLLTGCAEPSGDRAAVPPPEADSLAADFIVRGVYHGALFDSAAAAVDHEAIPGFMGAMRMQLRVADPAELRGLREGDKIRFRLAAPDGGGLRMSEIEPLPPETPLVLADVGPEAVPPEASLPADSVSGGR